MSYCVLPRSDHDRVFHVLFGCFHHIEVRSIYPCPRNWAHTVCLRVYAITFRNRPLAVYFGTLVLSKIALGLTSSFRKPPTIIALPPIPIDAFNLCAITVDLHLILFHNSIGTVFGTWLRPFCSDCCARLQNILLIESICRSLGVPRHRLVHVP